MNYTPYFLSLQATESLLKFLKILQNRWYFLVFIIPFPGYIESMKKCFILSSYIEGTIEEIAPIGPLDYVICADGGYAIAKKNNITPSIVIGDFDSGKEPPASVPFRKFPTTKDQTDLALCLDHALSMGITQAMILGGLGGRTDHTFANLQNLFYYGKKGLVLSIADRQNFITALVDGETTIPRRPEYYLSLFSFSEKSYGVTASGVSYPLENATLSCLFPLGISNEIIQEEAYIKVEKGMLLICLSKDRDDFTL